MSKTRASDRRKMDEDHCQKKSLRESSNCIEISDEDEVVSLSAVESIVWDCTEVKNRRISSEALLEHIKDLLESLGDMITNDY